MPHPIPDNVSAVVGLRYYLVAIPDDSAFSRAALEIYSELENAYKWGIEGQVQPDSEIASQKWAAAVAETVRLIQMGFPDNLLNAIDEVEELLEAIKLLTGCCPEMDASDGGFDTDDVQDGVGSVPQNIIDAGYASDANDWEGFASYRCMIAHVMVDDMEAKLRKLAPLVDAAGTVIGGIGTIAAIITAIFTSGLSALVTGIIASVGAAATIHKNLTSGDALSNLADKVASHHDILACALMDGDGVDDALSGMYSVISSEFTAIEGLILRNLNNKPILRALYGGRYAQQDIAANLAENGYVPSSYECDCLETEFLYHWNGSIQGWTAGGENLLQWRNPNISVVSNTSNGAQWKGSASSPTGTQLRDELGLTFVPTVGGGVARFRFVPGGNQPAMAVRFVIWEEGTNAKVISPSYSTGTYGWNTWVEVSWSWGGQYALRQGVRCVDVEANRSQAISGADPYIEIDYYGGTA